MSRRSDLLPPMSRAEWLFTLIVFVAGAGVLSLVLWAIGQVLVRFALTIR